MHDDLPEEFRRGLLAIQRVALRRES